MNPPNISEEYLIQKRIEICEKLKQTRIDKVITPETLAESVGIDKHHLNRIEAGKYNCNFNTIILICEALDLDIGFIAK